MRTAALSGAAVLLAAAVAALVVWWDFTVPSLGAARYQAVFLSNGQTYFGRYSDRIGPYVRIEDAYYIQTTRNEDPDKPPDSKILRRGAELHQPFARILVPKSAILFIEDLQPSSSIAQFIDQDQAQR